MIFKIDGGKSIRVPMGWATFGFLGSYSVKIKCKDLSLFPIGTIFKQINQHKEKSGSMAHAPEDIWLEVIDGSYHLGNECCLKCKPVDDNLEYLELKVKQKEKKK